MTAKKLLTLGLIILTVSILVMLFAYHLLNEQQDNSALLVAAGSGILGLIGCILASLGLLEGYRD